MKKMLVLSTLLFVLAGVVIPCRAEISEYEVLGIYSTGNYTVRDVRVRGNVAYLPVKVNSTTTKLDILDVSSPANITLLGSVSFTLPYSSSGVNPTNIILDGNYAYIGMWHGGFVIVDITDNANPQVVSTYSYDCAPHFKAMDGLLIDNGIMYVGWDYSYGLGVFDISDPYNPVKIANYAGILIARHVAKKDNYVFVSTYPGGYIRIFDVSNPAAPILVNSIQTYGSAVFVGDIVGNYYYMPDTRHTYGVKIYDVTDPENHTFVSQINTAALGLPWIFDLKVYGNEAIAVFHDPHNPLDCGSIASFDVTNPYAPKVNSILNVTPRVPGLFEYANHRLYLPGTGGLYIWGNPYPVVEDVYKSTNEDVSVSFTLHAIYSGSDPVTFSIGEASNGLASLDGDVVTYDPDPNYYGQDSLTYQASDGRNSSNIATVTITINPVNDAPVALDYSLSTNEDTSMAIGLTALDADGDPLTYSIVNGPAHGTLTGTVPDLTYEPHTDYYGPDSFTFKVNDGALDSNEATISITVNPVNDAPVAEAAGVQETLIAKQETFDGSASSDIDGTIVSYVWDFGDGSIAEGAVVTHAFDTAGDFTITLTVTDNEGAPGQTSITITVQTAAEAIPDIIALISELDIPEGTDNVLTSMFDNTLARLESENDTAASNKLEALLNYINAQEDKKLTEEEAAILQQLINDLINAVNN